MRFTKLIFIGIILTGFALYGAEYRAGESVYINEKDTVTTDLFASAQYVEINGPVLDDVYAACQEIIVNNEVGDDLLAFCQRVTVRGHVKDMALCFAEKITIDNTVDGDVLAMGSEVHLTKNAHIKGDLYIGCGKFYFNGGRIDGKISGGCGRVFLNGKVAKDVTLSVNNIEFGENYNAGEGTSLTLCNPLDDNLKNKPADLEITIKPQKYFYQSMFFIWSFIAALVVGLLMITLFKDFSRNINLFAREKVLKNGAIGSVLLIIVPTIIIIMTVLIITIPLALMLSAVYLFLLYISTIISGFILGCYIMDFIKKNGKPAKLFLSLLIGLIIIFLIVETPYIGWFFSFVSISFGMGTLVMYFYRQILGKEQTA